MIDKFEVAQIQNIDLVLFFSKGMSLQDWDRIGMFDREVALYERLCDCGIGVSFITYGGPSELNYEDRLPGIQILCNRWGVPNRVYESFLHRFHGNALKSCNLIKTNQMNGAQIAMRCAQHWEKPLIARMGYLWSEFVSRLNGKKNGAFSQAREVESKLFNSADRIVVTTEEMANTVGERSSSASGKTVVIPNYVETDRFARERATSKDYDLLFVGRLAPQKNVEALLVALGGLDIKALIIGDGELSGKLRSEFGDLNGKVRWGGNVSNSELPSFMNRSRIFVLPSHYEGHPKTLIEAMSCGMPVIGADSPGIREIIDHGINGWLSDTDSESIARSIGGLLDNLDLCKTLGKNARQYVVEHFSLDRVFKMEYQLYRQILDEHSFRVVN